MNAILAEGFDAALHFAAFVLVGESMGHPDRYYRTNVGGSLNLLEAALRAGVTRRAGGTPRCWSRAAT